MRRAVTQCARTTCAGEALSFQFGDHRAERVAVEWVAVQRFGVQNELPLGSVAERQFVTEAHFTAEELGRVVRFRSEPHVVDQLEFNLGEHRQETKDDFAGVHRLVGGISTTVTDHEE